MSNDIKVGDLVWVARAATCCGINKPLVPVFRVSSIRNIINGVCRHCGAQYPETVAYFSHSYPDERCVQLYRLEKFRDFPESELREVSKELEAQS